MDLFEKVSRWKVRWSHKGLISDEDLWDLSLRELDAMFKILNRQLKDTKEESLLTTKSHDDEVLEVKIAVVRHIVEQKQLEKQAIMEEAAKRERKQKLLSVLAEKHDAALRDLSAEEIEKMIQEL